MGRAAAEAIGPRLPVIEAQPGDAAQPRRPRGRQLAVHAELALAHALLLRRGHALALHRAVQADGAQAIVARLGAQRQLPVAAGEGERPAATRLAAERAAAFGLLELVASPGRRGNR